MDVDKAIEKRERENQERIKKFIQKRITFRPPKNCYE